MSVIDYAIKRNCDINNEPEDMRYWAAYLDGARAQRKEDEQCMLRLPCNPGDTIYKLWYKPCHLGEDYPDGYMCQGCIDECDLEKTVKPIVVPSIDFILRHWNGLHAGNVYFMTEEEALNKLKKEKESK